MLAIRTTSRCGRDCRVRRGAVPFVPARADGGMMKHGAARRRTRGFTLLEMLVVLVIAGLLVSLASLSLTRNPRTDLREEAQRIALLFETAGDEAQVRARPIAWQPTAHGFQFDVSSPDGWRTLRDDLLRPRDWDGGVTGADIDYPGSDTRASRVVFGTESIDTPVRVTLHSAAGSATIVGTGNGRYEVQ
ncbi:GspH/FimT family pseudopilin [Burkholderia cenocepacia]|uniref:GspH/FimT family pseudopilin n=1 Tax=Burkholderia cepacia complex TaxID=87882 RepID=UPI000981F9C1|nr:MULTISPECIES: GspH/FimT family pseudopilin [Burkholderia cepacia complex]AQQ33902.1 type II secretion system protein GspH [Burkholderia cenocepacia]ELW9450583.1 GspH/FimT family pseudopilin [Burkholderia cenocepacia]MBR7957860.1 GspH/FimT family pseudopilin [Burkholderia cenocepacia]MBR8080804.1 GspH/FimT family pseudopilin [Burkholderia cenocepacia]MBR8486376.1 GspH/FimT family pseudopilin [Burkholderia cenocepacia]